MAPTILVIEDDERIADMIAMFLGQRDYDAYAAYTATDALHYLDTQAPALILLDIMLPDINGLDACPLIRERTNAPIIFMSANLSYKRTLENLTACGQQFVGKPLNILHLAHLIRECLETPDETHLHESSGRP
ncbi:MAG: response regulator transcription factor [Anaerolineales bacterium]